MQTEIRIENGKIYVTARNCQTGERFTLREFTSFFEADTWMRSLTIDTVLSIIKGGK